MECIGQRHIPTALLHDCLRNLPVGEPSYYLLQRADEISDWTKGQPALESLAAFSFGRMFGRNGEVRWKRNGGGCSLLWLSEAELPEGFRPLGNWQPDKPQKAYLQGSWDDKREQWRETRIPRRLRYPVEKRGYPQVEVVSYRDAITQTVRFTRFVHFVEGG